MPKSRPQIPLRKPPAATPAALAAVPPGEAPDGIAVREFDAAARLAAQLCAAPLAVVALVDGTGVQVKGSVGADAAALDRELADWQLLRAVASVQADDLQQGALRIGARVFRFLASAPATDAAGRPLATVAVLDEQPRFLDAGQAKGLADLAAMLGVALQARRRGVELARQAMVDPLTGVANRRQFDNTLLAEMHHAMRTGEPFTLLLLSLDGVADIRTGFGAPAADLALREVSAAMARQVRLGDLIARLRGGEFGVVMRHGAAEAAELLAARIVGAVRQPITLASGDIVGLRVCIGIAAYDDGVESVAALTRHAELALQRARRQHEQRWNFFGRKFEAPSLRLVAGDDAGALGPPA